MAIVHVKKMVEHLICFPEIRDPCVQGLPANIRQSVQSSRRPRTFNLPSRDHLSAGLERAKHAVNRAGVHRIFAEAELLEALKKLVPVDFAGSQEQKEAGFQEAADSSGACLAVWAASSS